MLEEFKKCLPERIVVHLNEQKVETLSAAAVFADEYVLTHKAATATVPVKKACSVQPAVGENAKPGTSKKVRECYYCHKPGHIIANCLSLKRKDPKRPLQSSSQSKGAGLVKVKRSSELTEYRDHATPDVCFEPFISNSWVSLTGKKADQQPIKMLRDTGGSQ